MSVVENCPHCCKQIVVSVSAPVTERSEELLAALRTPTVSGKRRAVYVADGTSEWYLTYSGNLPKYKPFTRNDVGKLIDRKLLVREFPELDGCFVLAAKEGG